MIQNQESPAVLLVKNLLTDAEQAMAADDAGGLDQAQKLFEEALSVPGLHPVRATAIREALKKYSIRVTEQKTPPDWDSAHHALDMLEILHENQKVLQDDESRAWQRKLWLDQADFLLSQTKLDESFKIFSDLLESSQPDHQAELKNKISEIVRKNFPEQASQGGSNLLDEIIGRVQKLGLAGDELYQWLDTIRKALHAADKTAKEREEQLKQEFQRKQNMIYALIAILVLAAVFYTIFIIVKLY